MMPARRSPARPGRSLARSGRQIARNALMFAALGDPTRLELVERLARGGPASISSLAGSFDTTRQAVTKHLGVLAAAGIIGGERRGREHIWAINEDGLADARRHLEAIAGGWDETLARLKAHVEES